jgi:hypothetical protein
VKDNLFRLLLEGVVESRIKKDVFALSQHLFPCRVLNYRVPGREKATIYECDDFLAGRLEKTGFSIEREKHLARPFRRNIEKPIRKQFDAPAEGDPWYEIYNIIGEKKGIAYPDKIIVLLAHKDSQSWLTWVDSASPGAYDNAVGVAACLEIARILGNVPLQYSLRFIFCNEEHTPWSVETAAKNCRERGDNIIAVINIDAIGGKPPEDIVAGRKTNVSYYATSQGEWLADLMIELNQRFSIGLAQRKHLRERLNDDEKHFILMGYERAVLNCGSEPYGDPNYHLPSDTPDMVDYENVRMATQLSLAAVLALDSGLK